jgi:type III secretion system FlhB-like substrate exporter
MKIFPWNGGRKSSTFLSSVLIAMMVGNPAFAENKQTIRQIGTAAAQNEKPAQPLIRDFAISDSGVLRGKVLDRQGQPVANSPVVLLNGRSEVARAQSDARGDFQFQMVKGGLHQVATNGDMVVCRLWTAAAAPPAAQNAVLLCGGNTVVRGQCGNCNCRRRLCDSCSPCQSCNQCGTAPGTGAAPGTMAPPVPSVSTEELRALAPDLPAEQFAALTRADVVIANPDHYSVAIEFDGMGGARVVAKATDAVALQVQAAARAAGIPVARNAPLAQALFNQVEVGGAVPANLLAQLNQIMAGLQPAVAPPGETYDPGFQQQGGRATGNAAVLGAIIAAAVVIPIVANHDDDDAS